MTGFIRSSATAAARGRRIGAVGAEESGVGGEDAAMDAVVAETVGGRAAGVPAGVTSRDLILREAAAGVNSTLEV